MSFNEDQNPECPLCMEPFEMDDFNFFPCTCGYQICRFCWHRIRTDENGLCPACRKQYPEDPADFKPLSIEELQKIKSEKRQKDQQRKQKISECRKHLANVRVVQKNLVFVVGLPARLADAEVLKKHDYFGKFGKIHKVVVNQSTSYAGSQGPSASAYVTYCRPEDALRAIKSVNNIQVDGRTLKASLGTTKYCSHFLKNQPCPKGDCMYLHELGDEAASFTKEDMQQGKHQEYEKKLQDQILGNSNRKQTVSPTPQLISTKDSWPITAQNTKESKYSRSKDSSQGQKTEKQNRSKSKHNYSDGQKSKKNKSRNQENNQNKSSKEDNVSRKNQKQTKHSKDSSNQSSHQRSDELSNSKSTVTCTELSNVAEMNNKNSQTTYVHIAEKPVCTQPSANIKIIRSESPSLPPSPTSSSSSSLFTPFGSLSSNFLSSSPSPPPPPSSNSSQNFGIFSNSSVCQDNFAPDMLSSTIATECDKRQSSSDMPGKLNKNDSLFSHSFNFSPGEGSYSEYGSRADECLTDNSCWNSNYSINSQKQLEDDLDFDPWDESSKGLADLMAKEASHNIPYNNASMPPGFSQPLKHTMHNNQRISVPPPGFSAGQQQMQNSAPATHVHNTYGLNTDFSNKLLEDDKRQALMEKLPYLLQNSSYNYSNHAKSFTHHSPRDINSRVSDILRMKNIQEGFKALFPNVNVSFGSPNVQKNVSQNGPSWSTDREMPWMCNESNMPNMFTPGNMTEGQRNNSFLMKALQQLKIEEINPYNGHASYTTPVSLRGQWPSSAQCPPPGFLAPSRSPATNPFQHMQVNQKI